MKKSIFQLSIIIFILLIYMLLYKDFTRDDTFIFFQYVKNLLNGYGFSFNPGEVTYGFTSPMWIFMLYLIGIFHIDLLVGAKGLNLIFTIASILMFYLLTNIIIKDKNLSIVTTFVFSINSIFISNSLLGMETPLAVFLVILGIYFHLKEKGSNKSFIIAPFIFATSFLTRPETCLLIFLWLIDIIVTFKPKEAFKKIIIGVIEYCIVIIPWLVTSYKIFGTIIPNPVLVKAIYSYKFHDFIYELKRLFIIWCSGNIIEFCLIIIAIILFIMKYRLDKSKYLQSLKPHLLILGWIIGLPLSYLIRHVNVSDRYLLIIIPFVTIYGFVGLLYINKQIRKISKILIKIIIILFSLQSILLTFLIIYPHMITYNNKDKILKDIAKWFSIHTPEDTIIAIIDIGIMGYYSNRKILDLTGLINLEILKYKANKNIDNYLSLVKPNYIVDRNPIENNLIKKNPEKLAFYEPILFKKTKVIGFPHGFAESEYIGFTVYKVHWD